jgi:D-3-phosphoglycerate dehydrogenase
MDATYLPEDAIKEASRCSQCNEPNCIGGCPRRSIFTGGHCPAGFSDLLPDLYLHQCSWHGNARRQKQFYFPVGILQQAVRVFDMKILIADEVNPQCSSKLKAAGFDVTEKFDITGDELKNAINDYEILVVRSRTKVTKEIIDNGKKLKLIGRVGVGLDTIDTKAAEAAKVKVINTPQMSTIAVAELVMTMMLNLVRSVHLANESMKKGLWEKKRFHGMELNGKTLGVVGFGRIGRSVAERSSAFGMKILAYDVMLDEATLKKIGGERVSTIDELLRRSDIVTVHVPLMPETVRMINAETLAQMKAGSFIINASRGEVVDTKALLDALKIKKIAGAALDVYEHEPPTEPHEVELIKMPNVIATPHIGAQTGEAQVVGAIQMAENIINALKTL